jgi:hypothetical protein
MDTQSRDQQPARTDISRQNCWSERRIGDLNPGWCYHQTALAVPCLACQSDPAMTATAQNRRPGSPESPYFAGLDRKCQKTFSAYGHAMATHGRAVSATLFELAGLHLRAVFSQLPAYPPTPASRSQAAAGEPLEALSLYERGDGLSLEAALAFEQEAAGDWRADAARMREASDHLRRH